MPGPWKYLALVALLVAGSVSGQQPIETPTDAAGEPALGGEPVRPSTQLLESLEEPALRSLAAEVLARHPGIAAAEAEALAAERRAPQVRALPDPVASLTAFLETPETRTGPQRLMAGISQGLPWLGKLQLKEQAALYGAAMLEAEVEAKRLAALTEARRLYYELGFVDRYRSISEELKLHLLQHEEIARARYSTGVGLGQGVLKLQAEITRVERRLLELENRRVALEAQLNALRDAPAGAPLLRVELPAPREQELDLDALTERAFSLRPELTAAEARISRAETLVALAEKGYRPDFAVGLTYTLVDPRDDAAGRAMPPEGNGDDILGVQAGITLPVRRHKLAAAVEEAEHLRVSAAEAKRQWMATIRASVGDLTQQVPLSWRQLRLVGDLLVVQAEEALESAQAGYVAGTLNALDLLDAEHVLFEARTAVARAQADYLIGLARLEGAVGEPLKSTTAMERSDS